MKDYLFEIIETGEQILCEEADLEAARETLSQYFDLDELEFIDELSVEEGEWLGLDTY